MQPDSNSVLMKPVHGLPVWLDQLLFLLEITDNSWGLRLLLSWLLCGGSLVTLRSAYAFRSFLIIADCSSAKTEEPLSCSRKFITSLKCVTLHTVYYIPSWAPFLCSSKNYHSHLLTVHPKSHLCCRTVVKSNFFYQDTGRNRVRCGRAALFFMFSTALMSLGPERECFPSSHDLAGFTLPLSHEVDVSHFWQVLSNSLPSLKDFNLIPSFNQNQTASLRLKREKMNSGFPTGWK